MNSNYKCISCGGSAEPNQEKKYFCLECGLLMTGNLSSLDYGSAYVEDNFLYSLHIKQLNYFQNKANPLTKLIPFERRLISLISTRPKNSQVVDLGCGTGRFLRAIESVGFNATGFEVANILVEKLCQHGRDVRQGGISDFVASEINSNIVTLLEVVEHLPNPGEQIYQIYQEKSPQLLCVVVPAWDVRRKFDSSFLKHDKPPNHLTWWSEVALLKLMRSPGYKIRVEEILESRRSILGHILRNNFIFSSATILEWIKAIIKPPVFWYLGVAEKDEN